MKTKTILWAITALLVFSLTACNLPEVTPPASEVEPSATSEIQVAPPSPTAEVIAIEPVKINKSNVQQLASTHRAAVSNIQQITWANDSASVSVVTQNSDSNGNPIYGMTTLDTGTLSTLAVFSSSTDRIAAVAADGKTVATISQDMSTFKLFDTSADNSEIFNYSPGYLIGEITFSPDLRYIALTKMESWEVVLFNFNTRAEEKTLSGFETASPVFNAGFKESPQWIVWHARATLQLQEVGSGAMDGKFSHSDFVMAYALSYDGTILASSAVKNINDSVVPAISLWDTETGAEIQTLALSGSESVETTPSAAAVAFSPDGKLLAAAVGKDLQIWDPTTGTLLITLNGHTDSITQVAFSPDQKTIATSGMDNQLCLWQIAE